MERDRARRHWLPAAFPFRDEPAAFPRRARAGLPAGMRDLDPRHGAVLPQESRDALQECNVVVLPDPLVGGGDAAASLHRGRFHDDQAGAAGCATAQVNQMPVVGEAIDARILAHGRAGDAVAEGEIAQAQRREEHALRLSGGVGCRLSTFRTDRRAAVYSDSITYGSAALSTASFAIRPAPYSNPLSNACRFSFCMAGGTESATAWRSASCSRRLVTAPKNPTITMLSTTLRPSSSASRVAGTPYALTPFGIRSTRTNSCSVIRMPPGFSSGEKRVNASCDITTSTSGWVM